VALRDKSWHCRVALMPRLRYIVFCGGARSVAAVIDDIERLSSLLQDFTNDATLVLIGATATDLSAMPSSKL
jgi:hypothetical protein